MTASSPAPSPASVAPKADGANAADNNSLMPNLSAPAPRRISYLVSGGTAGLVVIAGLGWWAYGQVRKQEDSQSHAPTPAVATGAVGNRHFAATPPAPPSPATEKPAAAMASPPLVPAIEPDPIDVRSAIAGVGAPGDRRRNAGTGTGQQSNSRPTPIPEDAPILLVRPTDAALQAPVTNGRPGADDQPRGVAPSTDPAVRARQRLDQLSAQAAATLDSINRQLSVAPGGAAYPAGSIPGATTSASATSGAGASTALLGGAMPSSATPSVRARTLGDRSLTLPKGTTFTCALTTRVESTVAGFIGCQVLRNVYGDDGRVLLVERGSHLDGEYRSTQVHPGLTRIPAVWTRLRTPTGVVIELDSPATGPLGESGIEGTVDDRWGERVGAALLVALIDDGLAAAVRSTDGGATNTGNGTFVLSNTSSTGGHLADKVLDATINLPPRIVRDQGGVVGVFVARDIDFSSVYALQPSAR